jgi:hypothetical protein
MCPVLSAPPHCRFRTVPPMCTGALGAAELPTPSARVRRSRAMVDRMSSREEPWLRTP